MQTWEKNGTANVGMKQEKLVEQILVLWSLEKVSAAQFHSALLPEASRQVLWSSLQPLYLLLSHVPGAVLCTTSSSGSTAELCRVSLNSPGWLRKQGVITLSSPCISLHDGVKKQCTFVCRPDRVPSSFAIISTRWSVAPFAASVLSYGGPRYYPSSASKGSDCHINRRSFMGLLMGITQWAMWPCVFFRELQITLLDPSYAWNLDIISTSFRGFFVLFCFSLSAGLASRLSNQPLPVTECLFYLPGRSGPSKPAIQMSD